MGQAWRRRNYFVKKDLQGRYLFLSFVFAVTELLLFAALLGLSQAQKFTVSYENHSLRVDRAPLALFHQIFSDNWVFIVAGGLVVALAALFLSHRLAGPLHRFEQTLEEMLRGNLGATVRLRTRDEGKELAELLNRFNGNLRAALGELRDEADSIRSNLRQASDGARPEEVRAALDRAEGASLRLAEILNRYETGHV